MFSEFNLGAWLAKWAALLIAGGIAIVALIIWLWFNHSQALKNAAAPAKAQAAMSSGQVQSGQQAVHIVVDAGKREAATDDQTRHNTYVINQIPAAKTEVDPLVDAAIRHAICMRDSAADLPECKPVLGPNP